MKTKPLLITVAILALVAILAWRAQRPEPAESATAHPRTGQTLLPPDLLRQTREIRLSADGTSPAVVLRRTGDGDWILPDRFGIPVDFNKLGRLTQSLLETKVQRYVTENPDRLGRLGLGANRIALVDGENTELWSLETGVTPEKGGDYLRFNDEASAYLTHTSLDVDTAPDHWMDRRPLRFDETEVADVTLALGDETLRFERTDRDTPFVGVNLTENETAKSAEVSRLVRALLNARFTEAFAADHPDARAARANATTVSLTLFNGDTHTLRIGRPAPSPEPQTPVDEASVEETPVEEAPVVEEAPAIEGDPAQPEVAKPGPVFVFYESSAPDFPWNQVMETAALRFPDRLFEELPTTRETLIEEAADRP